MPLNDVPAETTSHGQWPLEVERVSFTHLLESAAIQSLRRQIAGKSTLPAVSCRQADTVDGYRIADLERGGNGFGSDIQCRALVSPSQAE